MNEKPIKQVDIFGWDVFNWSRALDIWEKALPQINHPLKCLEIGARNGGLSLWLAQQGHRVICSDLQDTQKNAATLHQKFGVADNIHYRDLDASSLPYANEFDVIIFKSILGGIGRNDNWEVQQQVINQIHHSLKPGGKLLFAENLRSSPIHQFFRSKFQPWGSSWRYLSLDEVEELLKGFKSHKIKTCGFAGAFGRSERQRAILGKLDKALIDRLVPNNWNYVVYGWAEK